MSYPEVPGVLRIVRGYILTEAMICLPGPSPRTRVPTYPYIARLLVPLRGYCGTVGSTGGKFHTWHSISRIDNKRPTRVSITYIDNHAHCEAIESASGRRCPRFRVENLCCFCFPCAGALQGGAHSLRARRRRGEARGRRAEQTLMAVYNTKGYSSTYLAMGFANVRAGTW